MAYSDNTAFRKVKDPSLTKLLNNTVNNGTILGNGSVSDPAFSFVSSPSSGMYLTASSAGPVVSISASGTQIMSFSGTQVKIPLTTSSTSSTTGSLVLSGGLGVAQNINLAGEYLRGSTGTLTVPSYSFTASTSSGLYLTPTANGPVVSVSASGAQVISFSGTQVSVPITTTSSSSTTGSLRVSGGVGIAENLFLGGKLGYAVTTASGATAIPITHTVVYWTSTATGNALTLANGTSGQVITIVYLAEAAGGDTGILTPASVLGYATITFNAIGDTASLVYTTAGWAIIGSRGVTVA